MILQSGDMNATMSRDKFPGANRAARGGQWMRELRISRSSSDCMERSGAQQAAGVKLKQKSYTTNKVIQLELGLY